MSAILTQGGKVVAYAGRALAAVESRYSQTNLLAAVYGVEHFHIYLFASSFTLVTDLKPLLGIVERQKPASARIEQWRLRLMHYDFQFLYRRGKDDLNPADFMSRHPYSESKRNNAAESFVASIIQNAVPKAMTLENVRSAIREDKVLQKAKAAIQSGKWYCDPDIAPFERFRDEYSIYDGIILRDHRLVVPFSLHAQVVSIAHHTHQGIVKTKQFIREKVWFPLY